MPAGVHRGRRGAPMPAGCAEADGEADRRAGVGGLCAGVGGLCAEAGGLGAEVGGAPGPMVPAGGRGTPPGRG
jgi:hypothetical protein